MPRVKILLAISALLLSALACVTIMGEEKRPIEVNDFATQAPGAPDPNPPSADASCPALTDQIMQAATAGSGEVDDSSSTMDEEVLLATYEVSGDELSEPTFENVSSDLQDEQHDTATQAQVWEFFTALIPADQRTAIAEYAITTDGVDNTLASVSQTRTDPNAWSLQVDIADTSDYYNLTYTLVHEFGHLLTLGPRQVPPSLAVFNNPDDDNIYLSEAGKCPDYFPGEGCARPDSYINNFYNSFWTDIHDEWNQINLEEDDDLYYEKLDAFYAKYQDQFVTDYAPTNPEEDIAESWTFFVLSPMPQDSSVADEKVLFFYDYPELVGLRSQILGNLCGSFPQ